MKSSFKRLASSLISVVFVVVAVVVFFNFVMPLYREIIVIRGEEAGKRVVLENQKKVIEQVKRLVAAYEEGSRLQDVVSSALPMTPSTAEAILQLSGMAQANNLVPRAFTITPAAKASTISRNAIRSAATLVKPAASVAIRMEASGTYADFKNFMQNLETNIRIFDVNDISLQPIGKAPQELYSYTVTVAAHYQTQ